MCVGIPLALGCLCEASVQVNYRLLLTYTPHPFTTHSTSLLTHHSSPLHHSFYLTPHPSLFTLTSDPHQHLYPSSLSPITPSLLTHHSSPITLHPSPITLNSSPITLLPHLHHSSFIWIFQVLATVHTVKIYVHALNSNLRPTC